MGDDITLESLEGLWKDSGASKGGLNAEFFAMICGMVKELPLEDRRKFYRGKQGIITRALFECDSRSGAYELARAAGVSITLEKMGLIVEGPKGWRDAKTKRRVSTRLRELGRLGFQDNEGARTWLGDNWPFIVDMPLAEWRAWVRSQNPRAKV